MKLAVVGGRDFNSFELLRSTLDKIKHKIDMICSGGATGADELAEKYAEENKIPIKIFLPQWDKFGKKAGPLRNKQIVDFSDCCVAFWDGKSRGTLSTINMCRKSGTPLKICKY